MSTYLKQLQNDMASRALAHAPLNYVNVIAVNELTIETQVAQGLACTTDRNGRIGAALHILPALLNVDTPNAPGPITRGRITLRAQEDPKLNTTGLTAEEIALIALDLFHVWAPGYLGGCLCAAKDALEASLAFAPRLSYDVSFTFPLALAQTQRPARPIMVLAAGQMTITCATAGAEIRYTVDESYPARDKSLYEAAFAVDAGARVRACAYKDGFAGSDVVELLA